LRLDLAHDDRITTFLWLRDPLDDELLPGIFRKPRGIGGDDQILEQAVILVDRFLFYPARVVPEDELSDPPNIEAGTKQGAEPNLALGFRNVLYGQNADRVIAEILNEYAGVGLRRQGHGNDGEAESENGATGERARINTHVVT
ncbi:MAG: hypothetical protein QF609_03635, partial [Gammaproteobacteria bacterium]|nr:hypothetical protein [Gammaproteobacteria bacterium]